MKQMWVKRLFLFIKSKVKNFSYQKALVFFVCLALSSFLWLLNSLEKHYTNRISVPVNYVDFPKDKQLYGSLPRNFDLMVDAYGYTLLSYKLRLAFSPILLNVSELVDNALEKGGRYRYTISTVNHKEEIEKQISSEIKILSIKPDTLVFNFSKIITRRVKVKPAIKLSFEKEYSLVNDAITSPDSIFVSGPKNVLDTIKVIPTQFQEYTKLAHSFDQKVALQIPKGLECEVKDINLSVAVEQNTEVNFEVPIQVINNPSDISIKTFPGKIKVVCRIGVSKYKKLDYNSFKAFINYDNISGKDTRLAVILENHSNVVLSTSYSPTEVEYIMEHEK
jgi:YbbR domain-containing protein